MKQICRTFSTKDPHTNDTGTNTGTNTNTSHNNF